MPGSPRRPRASSARPTIRADYEQVIDIVDVWFEFGLHPRLRAGERPRHLPWPAALYLEGSDQHRGWFHSSLLEAAAPAAGRPIKAVLTHGFVLDEEGRKMSKSLGNVVAPQEVVRPIRRRHPAPVGDGSDISEDLRIGPEILKTQADIYRRLRNTLRWLLGALDGFTEAERVPVAEMPRTGALGAAPAGRTGRRVARRPCDDFCSTACSPSCTISAPPTCRRSISTSARTRCTANRPRSLRRRAARTVLDIVLALPVQLAGAVAVLHRRGSLAGPPSRRRRQRPPGEASRRCRRRGATRPWRSAGTAIRDMRRVVTGALEVERGAKRIGSSLQAAPTGPT